MPGIEEAADQIAVLTAMPTLTKPINQDSSLTNSKTLPITVIIATFNEAANLDSCLRSLNAVERVVVVDSLSTDSTPEIAHSRGVELIPFHYSGGYPKKRQWALDNMVINTPWTMLVDADEQITPELWTEIETAFNSRKSCDAYLISKGFHFLGKRFRFGGFSHSAILLFKTGRARFEQTAGNMANGQDMEVHERLLVDGSVGRLKNPLIHQDFKGLSAYIDRHNKYSTWEAGIRAHYMSAGSWGDQTIQAKLLGNTQSFRRFIKPFVLKIPFEPWLWFLYHFVFRGGFLEGRRGYIAACLRRSYIEQARAKVYELQLRTSTEKADRS